MRKKKAQHTGNVQGKVCGALTDEDLTCKYGNLIVVLQNNHNNSKTNTEKFIILIRTFGGISVTN